MKQRPPIGRIRPLAATAGQLRMLRAPLVPMIWRRAARPARAISILHAAQPAPVPAGTPNIAINIHLAWAAAPPKPAMVIERILHQIFRAGRDGARVETNRLFRLVETLSRAMPPARASLPGPASVPGMRRGAARLEWADAADRSSPRFAEPGEPSWSSQMARRATAMRVPASMPSGSRDVDPPALARHAMPRRHRLEAEPVITGPGLVARTCLRQRPRPAARPIAEPPPGTVRDAPVGATPRIWKKARGGSATPGFAPFETGNSVTPPASWKPRAALIWRSPSSDDARQEPMRGADVAFAASAGQGIALLTAARAPAPQPAAAPAAVQAPDMNRLVDEVVRRLERIGRDERLRRGL